MYMYVLLLQIHHVPPYRQANEKQRTYLEAEKRLWGTCFKTEGKGKKDSVFEKAARDMCETFSQDKQIMRQPLPECLTPEEDRCIREQAAAFGLTVTTHQRYGREITYLNKPNFQELVKYISKNEMQTVFRLLLYFQRESYIL